MATRNQKAAADAEARRLPKWTPFARAFARNDPANRMLLVQDMLRTLEAKGQPIPQWRAEEEVDRVLRLEVWKNSRYQVSIDRDLGDIPGWPKLVHLSIKRIDRDVPREERWRDFQRVKNELIGEECEAVELYPAESRVVDTANSFHLWCFAEPGGFPFGWRTGLKLDDDPKSKARQRAFDDD